MKRKLVCKCIATMVRSPVVGKFEVEEESKCIATVVCSPVMG